MPAGWKYVLVKTLGLTDVKVPVYDEATGRFLPGDGAGGSGGSVTENVVEFAKTDGGDHDNIIGTLLAGDNRLSLPDALDRPVSIGVVLPDPAEGACTLTVPPGLINYGVVGLGSFDGQGVVDATPITKIPSQVAAPLGAEPPGLGMVYVGRSGSGPGGELFIAAYLMSGSYFTPSTIQVGYDLGLTERPADGTIPANLSDPVYAASEDDLVTPFGTPPSGALNIYIYVRIEYEGYYTTLGTWLEFSDWEDNFNNLNNLNSGAMTGDRFFNESGWVDLIHDGPNVVTYSFNSLTAEPLAPDWPVLHTPVDGDWSKGLILRFSPNDAGDGYLVAWIDDDGPSASDDGPSASGVYRLDLRYENPLKSDPTVGSGYSDSGSGDPDLMLIGVDFSLLPDDKSSMVVLLRDGKWRIIPLGWPPLTRGPWTLAIRFDSYDENNSVEMGHSLSEVLDWGFIPSSQDVFMQFDVTDKGS